VSATPNAAPQLRFHTDPGRFLAEAADHLAADPVVSTVVTTAAHRLVAQPDSELPPPDRYWWLAVTDADGAVVGAGMRTASFAPYPLFLLPMPGEAAVALARVLHERGEPVPEITGALPAAELCAAELARLDGNRFDQGYHLRLHELGELVQPKPVPGGLRTATAADLELVESWLAAFDDDADEQAGRPRGSSAHTFPGRRWLLGRITTGQFSFWVDAAGQPVNLTAASLPAFGVSRVGPVYTPPSQRGRGWASNAVAEVSRRIQAGGARACLFTDQANPTSNKIYAALGYGPVVDMVNLVVTPGRESP
jgi:hypothetical protein